MSFKSRDLSVQVGPDEGEFDTPCCPCRSTGVDWLDSPSGSQLDDLQKQLRAALEVEAP